MQHEISVSIRHEGRPPRAIRVSRQGAIIGRDPHADIQLDHPDVSRVHARIEHDGVGFKLQDLVSATGTWLGSAEISEHRLRGQEEVRIGPFELRFRLVQGEPAGEEEVLRSPGDELLDLA
jgi:pSer/pThr/pTyr-binding forkhead associated (FHA) protein